MEEIQEETNEEIQLEGEEEEEILNSEGERLQFQESLTVFLERVEREKKKEAQADMNMLHAEDKALDPEVAPAEEQDPNLDMIFIPEDEDRPGRGLQNSRLLKVSHLMDKKEERNVGQRDGFQMNPDVF